MNDIVITLNGPSSAGKSSIAMELQKRLHARGKVSSIVSIDDYLRMSVEEPIWEDDVFECMPDLCRDVLQALRQGHVVIVDHVITSARIYDRLIDAIRGKNMLSVLINCDANILKNREAARGNRFVGSAEASLQYLYPQEGYDVCIDSGAMQPCEAADIILKAIKDSQWKKSVQND